MTEILRNFAKTSDVLEKAAESLKEELGIFKETEFIFLFSEQNTG